MPAAGLIVNELPLAYEQPLFFFYRSANSSKASLYSSLPLLTAMS